MRRGRTWGGSASGDAEVGGALLRCPRARSVIVPIAHLLGFVLGRREVTWGQENAPPPRGERSFRPRPSSLPDLPLWVPIGGDGFDV